MGTKELDDLVQFTVGFGIFNSHLTIVDQTPVSFKGSWLAVYDLVLAVFDWF